MVASFFSEEEQRFLGRLGRIARTEDGQLRLKYAAIDPAARYVVCSCVRPDCWTKELRPLREHAVALYRVLVDCGSADLFGEPHGRVDPWPGTVHALQMAASLDDVFADPSITDDGESAMWCRSAFEHDEEQREAASKYVAAMAFFNFVWNAYEAAVKVALQSGFAKDKLPVRARRFFALRPSPVADTSSFQASYRYARGLCGRVPVLRGEVSDIESKYHLEGAAAAAELGRLFRNYVVHGGEQMPTYSGQQALARFYSVSRLLLMLIQGLAATRLVDEEAALPLFSSSDEDGEDALPAGMVLYNLQRHPALWPDGSRRDGGASDEPAPTLD